MPAKELRRPIGPHGPLPNLLHVGHREATRLLGPEPSAGPLAQLIDWAHGLAPDAIHLVHIRDWHDPATLHSANTCSDSGHIASKAPPARGFCWGWMSGPGPPATR